MPATVRTPPLPAELNDDKVYTFDVLAECGGFSVDTLQRQITAGIGPTVTRLSPRRVGIRGRHWREWLDARAERRGTQ
jgi:hypothetical protein